MRTRGAGTRCRRSAGVKVEDGACDASCAHGGQCVSAGGASVCSCAGAWGGARCERYVGHDHECVARCTPPTLCVWAQHESGADVYCACPAGAACVSQHLTPAPPPAIPALPAHPAQHAATGALWATALLVLVVALSALLFVLHRRRRRGFVHARLADNVEINNPMYLAGEDDFDHHHHQNGVGVGVGGVIGGGGRHFANPVYESVYAPRAVYTPPQEQARLLRSRGAPPSPASPGEGPAPSHAAPERAALL